MLTFPFHLMPGSLASTPEQYELERRKIAAQNNESFILAARLLAMTSFVNCWHMNEHESAAMWKLYLKSDEGIAIRTTPNRLAETVKPASLEVDIGEVHYIDYNKDKIDDSNMLNFVMHKRLSFAHEREVRAVIWMTGTDTSKTPGVPIPVDLPTLIERIFVAPTAPGWFHQLVESVAKTYKLDVEVVQSSLAENPLA